MNEKEIKKSNNVGKCFEDLSNGEMKRAQSQYQGDMQGELTPSLSALLKTKLFCK